MIGLIQVDGRLPNLALMKLGAYHVSRGDEVEWYLGPLFPYDKVYASKLFSFSSQRKIPDKAIVGGTGIDFKNRLPPDIDAVDPGKGWFLYPSYPNHLGFSQIGCRLRCEFCCVPQKEGAVKPLHNIDSLLTNPNGGNRLVLLDNDFFGQPDWVDRCEEIITRKLRVSFAQGLNIRLLTEEQAGYLSRISFWNPSFKKPQVTFAWDRHKDKTFIQRGLERCVAAGIKPYRIQFFVLIGFDSTPEEDLERVETIRSWGADPFVMPYQKDDPYQRRFTRWVNHRAIFNTISFQEYRNHYAAPSHH